MRASGLSLPDGDFKWILHYHEHLTKFSILRPLQQKTALNIAKELLQITETLTASTHPARSRRNIAAENLKKQADRMVMGGKGILPSVTIGDNILIPIPAFDRGRGDPSNLVAVILAEEDRKYRVGTRHGALNTWLERNAFAPTKFRSMTSADVQTDVEHSLRELVRLGSVGTGQGYRRCSCRGACNSKKCTCHKNDMKCN